MSDPKEDLIALLDDAFLNSDSNFGMPNTKQVADHLITHGVTVQKWTPVTERLPENDYGKHWKERQYYLVRLQNGLMRVARYGYKEYGWWVDSHDCVLDEKRYTGVTHWMPLPQPPTNNITPPRNGDEH